ncbi:uncharacterized protein LOC109789944 [Cajanus cajan]|uniref:uncharacterized protein LOC109789944 n=1 Tax=Cajanus cajan TaxID=3821 RepID=UPI00098D82AE|nr:uncharacterized protein LOC109789944 [Cajanus cajan]
MGQMITMLKKHNMFEVLYGWLLAKIASKLEVLPGSDFCVGYEEAIKYGGRVILGDRPVQITMRRTWSKMPLQHKTKLLFSCLFGICGFLVSVDNTTCHNCTLIKVDSVNKPGILLEVVQILTDLDFIITKAYISSDGGWFMDGMFVSELNFYLKCINNYADVPCSCLLLA